MVALVVLGAAAASAQSDTPMTAVEMAVACAAPPSTAGQPAHALHVIGAQDTVPRTLFGARDLLVIDGGTMAGVRLGQQFFIRRANRFGMSSAQGPHFVSTAGWLRVVAANESNAIAMVEHSCGGIFQMDYLEPFVAPVVPSGADRDVGSGEPDFTSLGRILVGSEDRHTVGTGDFVLIDRGSDQGVAPGARFAVYRDMGARGMPLASIGEAVVVSTGPTLALTRITRARDAVLSGDYVALRK